MMHKRILAFPPLWKKIFLPLQHPIFRPPPPTVYYSIWPKKYMRWKMNKNEEITCYHYYRYNNTQNKLLYSLKEKKVTWLVFIEKLREFVGNSCHELSLLISDQNPDQLYVARSLIQSFIQQLHPHRKVQILIITVVLFFVRFILNFTCYSLRDTINW